MRIQIEVPESDSEELKTLMKDLGIETYKDLFSNAITLLYWTAKEASEGRIIAAVDPVRNTMKEVLMPVLARLARKRETAHAGSEVGH